MHCFKQFFSIVGYVIEICAHFATLIFCLSSYYAEETLCIKLKNKRIYFVAQKTHTIFLLSGKMFDIC